MSGKPFGLIEAGGTKFVLGVADGNGAIIARHRIPTTKPAATLAAALDWFGDRSAGYTGFGIASFGPLGLDPDAPDWGHITATTKADWSNVDLVGPFARRFACPVAIDTDVNGAALAEHRWGAGRGLRSILYLTVGTGIGGGAVIDGRVLRGLSHPEMGHIRMERHPDDAGFAGVCPYHGACLEGLASGPAIIARWGRSLSELGPAHPGASIIAWYLAQALTSYRAILSPQRIILGGGVMGTAGLLGRVQADAARLAAGYLPDPPHDLIVAPGLGDDAGLMGALALAQAISSTS